MTRTTKVAASSEIIKLFKAASNLPDNQQGYLQLLLIYLHALNLHDLLNLQASDVDLVKFEIRILRHDQKGKSTGLESVHPISIEEAALVAKLMRPGEPKLFGGAEERKQLAERVRQAYRQARKAAGLSSHNREPDELAEATCRYLFKRGHSPEAVVRFCRGVECRVENANTLALGGRPHSEIARVAGRRQAGLSRQ